MILSLIMLDSCHRPNLAAWQNVALLLFCLLPVLLAQSQSNPDSVSVSEKYKTYSVILHMKNEDALEKRVLAAASAEGELAGKYLTMSELADDYGRSPEEIDTISKHLELLGGKIMLIGKARLSLEVEFPHDIDSLQDTTMTSTSRFRLPSHQEMMRQREENFHPSVIRSAKLLHPNNQPEDMTKSELLDPRVLTSMECRLAHALQMLSDHPVDLIYEKPAKKRQQSIPQQQTSRKSKSNSNLVSVEGLNRQESPSQASQIELSYLYSTPPLYQLTDVSLQTIYDDTDINYYLLQYIPICPNGQVESSSNPCVDQVYLLYNERILFENYSVNNIPGYENATSLKSFSKQTCAVFFEQRGGSGSDACPKLKVPEDAYIYSFNILEDFGDLTGKIYTFIPRFVFTNGEFFQSTGSIRNYGETATASNVKSMYSMPLGSNVAEGQRILLTLVPVVVEYYVNLDDAAQNAQLSNTTNPQVEFLSQSFWAADNMENDFSGAAAEAALDLQTVGSLAEGANIQFLPNGDAYNQGPNQGSTAPALVASDWVLGIMQMSPDLPSVVSMSFGGAFQPIATVMVNTNLLMLTSLGVTIVAASGDDGACLGNNGNIVVPQYPAGSPWVLAVGSTQGPVMVGNRTGEIACMSYFGGEITTGGGLSAFYRPSWQDKHVLPYLEAFYGKPNIPNDTTSFLNPAGRGYPDVSFTGTKIPTIFKGALSPESGTSYSAPAWASIIAILNTARNKAGLGNLGFVNPFIYWAAENFPDAFNDIVDGDNRYGYRNDYSFVCEVGYPAAVGWDAATGFGTPNVAVLTEAALAYGQPRVDNCINNSTHCTCFVEDFLTCAVPSVDTGKCHVKRCSGSVCGCDVPEEAKGLCVIQEVNFYSFDEPVEFDSLPSACSLKTVQSVTPAWAA